MLTNNPKIVTTSLAACWDPKQPSTVPSVSVIADKIADLSSKAYTTYTSGGITYYVWTYTSSGSFNTGDYPLDLDILLVGGGGGGGAYAAGAGGGAGGVRALSKQTVPAGIHVIQVGAGGAGGIWTTPIAQKGDETMWNYTSNFAFSAPAFLANGGGEGGRGWSTQAGGDGGCGGGGGGYAAATPVVAGLGGSGNSATSSMGGSYDPVEGYDGGDGWMVSANNGAGGGGGGAAAVGTDANPAGSGTAGSGGAGLGNDWRTGSTQYYGGGGGGGSYQGTDGTGGTGGGGNGGDQYAKTPGTANTGGGGGGSDDYLSVINAGAAGGSGIVVIRLADVPGSINRSFLSDQAMGGGTAQMYTGTCFDFDGTDDLVLTSDPVITGTGDFTLTAWINRATINTYDFICGNYSSPVNSSGIEFYGTNTGEIRCYILGSVTTSTALVAGTWYHVGVRRLAGVVQLYINGVADGSPVSRTTSITGNLNFSIGNGPNYTSENFDGKIADVKAFDVALSAANIKELYDDSKVIIPTKNAAAGGFVSQTNLIGWWPLAEGAGDICYDGSGNGYHGIVSNEDGDEWLTGQTGCPQLVTGYNRPNEFKNARSNYIQVASNGSYTFANQSYTVTAWINPAVSPPSGDRVIFSYDYTSHSQPYYAIQIRMLSDGALYLGWNNGSTFQSIRTAASTFTTTTWTHIACTYTSGSQKIYIDGVQATSGTRTDTITFYNQEVWIGRANYGGYFDGLINELVVYDSALTLAQVQALAATDPNGGPLPPDPMSLSNSSNVVGYWRNDGNPSLASTATWTDRSGNGNNGTAYGAPYDLLFKQGYNGSESANSGRDNQGFPLKQKDVGAIGMYLHGVPAAGSATDPGNSANPLMAPPGQGFISSGEVNSGNAFAVSAWINITSLGTGYVRPIARKQTQNGHWPAYGLSVTSTGQLRGEYSTTNYGQCLETYNTAAGVIEQDKWYYVVFLKPTGSPSVNYLDVKFYVNGVDTAWTNSLYGNHLYSNTVATSTQPTYMGRFIDGNDLTGNWVNAFVGQMGPVSIYSRGLTPEEVTQNFNAQRSRFNV